MSNAKQATPVVEITLNDKSYKVKFGMKAIICMDREFGINLTDQASLNELENTPSQVSRLLWASLQRYHPELTIVDVENLLDDANYDEVAKALQDAFSRSSEDEGKKKQGGKATEEGQ